MQTITTTVTDIALKYGKTEKGPWTLATINCADGKKYKTFDEKLLEKAKAALTGASTVEISFESTEKSFKDERTGKQVPYTEREVKEITVKGGAAPVPQTGQPATVSTGDWMLRDRIQFRREAQMVALQTAAQVMAACLSAQVENYKYDDAMRIVKVEARAIYAATFKPLEGGKDEDPDTAIDAEEEAEVVS